MVQDRYGSVEVLLLRDIDKPEIGGHDVLVHVRAAGVNPADWAVMSGLPYIARPVYGLRKPKNSVRGTDVAGQVEAVGTSVTRFRPGDEVFGWCVGAYAEYTSVSEDALALKPANLTFEQAASVPMAGLVALQALRDQGNVQAGQSVLINGASGGIGTFAVQIAKSLGAQVTGVCSTRNVDLVRSIGADQVIDYAQQDFTQGRAALRLHPGQRGEPFAVRPARRAHPDGNARAQRRRVRQSLVRQWGSGDQGARTESVREPHAAAVSRLLQSRGPGRAQGDDRSRQAHTGHRPHLSVDRNSPGDSSCWKGARFRQGRHHRVTPAR